MAKQTQKTFRELAEQCNAQPIKEVLEHAAGCVFTGYGANQKCISPLRPNGSLGSFNINTVSNIFHDWKLDVVGGPVRFYMEYYGLEFVDAVKRLAMDFNLGTFSGRIAADVEKKVLTVPTTTKKRLNIDVINTVYNIFLDMCTLSEEDTALMKCRGFSEEEIKEYKFKTFPRRTITFRKSLEDKVAEALGSVDYLFEVPGFFKKEGEAFSFGYQSGVIIPCRNHIGQIIGLQIRKRDPDASNKYVWFSSAYCLAEDPDNNYVQDGLSPGSPIGFEKGKKTKNMFITEGFFKARALRQQFDASAISIQGVTNWRPIVSMVKELKSMYPKFERVVIAYDSDMCYNLNVLVQAEKLGEELVKQGLRVDYALWDYTEETKGIDDLIKEVGDITPYLRIKSFDTFSSGVEKVQSEVDMKSSDEEVKCSYIKNVFKV